jgi:hypothetical protein
MSEHDILKIREPVDRATDFPGNSAAAEQCPEGHTVVLMEPLKAGGSTEAIAWLDEVGELKSIPDVSTGPPLPEGQLHFYCVPADAMEFIRKPPSTQPGAGE